MGLQRYLRFPEDPDSQSSLGIDSLITPARRQIAASLGPGLPESFGCVGASSPVHQPGPCTDGGQHLSQLILACGNRGGVSCVRSPTLSGWQER